MPYSGLIQRWAAVLVALICVSPLRAAQEKGPRPLTIDDFFALKSVSSPQVSPDGKWVAYTVGETDLKKDKGESSLWMVPSAGGEPVRMTAKGYSAGSPRWSPDGKYLSFRASRGEKAKSQVWAFDLRGGDAQQLTEVKQGISGFEWSPDSKRLLLAIHDPDPDQEDENDDKATADAKKKPKPWVIDRLQFKRDYAGYLNRRRTHLYVFRLSDKSLTQITSGDYDDEGGVWSPDGRLVAFVSNRTAEPDGNENSDIWVVSADNTDKGKTLLRITDNPGSDGEPCWSPDGKWLAYTTVTHPGLIWYATNRLALISSDGGQPRILADSLDRNVRGPEFIDEGRALRFHLEDSAEEQLAEISLDDESIRRVVSGARSVNGFHAAGGTTALRIGEPHLPGDIFTLDGGELHRLTEVNQDLLSQIRLGEVRNIHFPSQDGTEIEGFLITPYGYDSKFRYPTLLRIHGGPVAQYDHDFTFENQLLAANGYVVVLVNPRGSSGYGQAFSMGIYKDWGHKDFQDVMAGVDYAIREGYADPDRLGVGGWSYGGILTNYVITQTDRFQGAITGASEVLYVANYGHDHYQLQWEKELGLPWENRDLWERLSPFNSVEKIVTPTLIMGGEKDWNVPILNSEQLYQALKRLGRTTELVVYPGQHHGIQLPSFQKDRWERYLAWYGKYVKGDGKAAKKE